MRASVAYLYGIDNEDVREARACSNPLSDFIWTNMAIGWPIYNAAMASMCGTSHR